MQNEVIYKEKGFTKNKKHENLYINGLSCVYIKRLSLLKHFFYLFSEIFSFFEA